MCALYCGPSTTDDKLIHLDPHFCQSAQILEENEDPCELDVKVTSTHTHTHVHTHTHTHTRAHTHTHTHSRTTAPPLVRSQPVGWIPPAPSGSTVRGWSSSRCSKKRQRKSWPLQNRKVGGQYTGRCCLKIMCRKETFEILW